MESSESTATQIRARFLEYFRTRGHVIAKSAPLVPQNDPTLMFVNAGMVQFKDVFTGKDARPFARAASSQKCIRISGKHNDLENVGVTARHHTFFEMLGNFSFGDYFKADAIAYAWEFLLKEMGLPPDRLLITVFKGEDGVPADDEAAEIWRKVTGFGDDRILRLGKADNFWSMGDTGPCGPCSEIHFFHGAEPTVSTFGDEPRIDGLGWTEIWNLVFMQFDRAEKDGPLVALPAPSIDTGMGLERIAAAVQGVTSNYDTDLLRALVDLAGSIAHKTYAGSTADDDVSMRVIADHARTTAFLIAEGVMPERNQKEYVLRRVMRRAIRHGQRLGIERPFFAEVTLKVVELMAQSYPELSERRELIARVTEDEEVRFRASLKRGIKILDERFEEMRQRNETQLSAGVAADLYTTYGFPLDLTEVIARESALTVDVEGAWRIVKGAAEADGPIDPTAALHPVYHELRSSLASTTFTGYEQEKGDSHVAALVLVEKDGDKTKKRIVEAAGPLAAVEVAVKVTPFYAESGGQVGDRGTITAAGATIDIHDTQRPLPGLVLHQGIVREGTIATGDAVRLTIDTDARQATRRNHSATHLLHWALKQVLGEHAMQKGSRVGPEMLRFDFAHNRPLSRDEIDRIEDLVNAKVLLNAPVLTDVLPIEEAKRRGAVAIFEEKYGDVVRMLTMTPDSVELCGGTHVRALGDLGLFKIDGESSVAAGVRRLFASTGQNARRAVRETEALLARVRTLVKSSGGDVVDKVQKLLLHERELEKKVAELEKRLLEGSGPGGGADAMAAAAREISGVRILAIRVADGTAPGALRELAEKLRNKLGERSAVCLGAVTAGKAQLCVMVGRLSTESLKAGEIVQKLAQRVSGSGGGRPDMAQAGGTDVGAIDSAVEAFYTETERILRPD